MRDPAFGWTAEMQTKALRLGLRVVEVPVDARRRRTGTSKISGRVVPVFRAGWAILTTILRCRFAAPPSATVRRSVAVDAAAGVDSAAGAQSLSGAVS
jgi:hypothetical protein